MIDSKIEASSTNYEEDGGAMGIGADLSFKALGINGKIYLNYGFYDAKGKYMDNTNQKMGLKIAYPIGDLTPSLDYYVKGKNMTNGDPQIDDVKQNDNKAVYTVKVSYKLLPELSFALSYKSTESTSNVESVEYSGSTTQLTVMYVY